MIIVDTNIISELMRSSPSINVVDWLEQQDTMELYTTTITIAEITYGLNALPSGSRKQELENRFDNAMRDAFLHRILLFTEPAARIYGKIMSHRKTLGKPLSAFDGQIAAIALSHSASLATRNVNDFLHCGLNIINPFD